MGQSAARGRTTRVFDFGYADDHLDLSIAKRFGAAGFQVALLARDAEKRDRLDGHGVTARPYVADAGGRPGLAAALAQVEADFGSSDVLEYSPSRQLHRAGARCRIQLNTRTPGEHQQ